MSEPKTDFRKLEKLIENMKANNGSGFDLQANREEILGHLETAYDLAEYTERCAVHHGTKPRMGALNALSFLQFYPTILDVTRSYTDGVLAPLPSDEVVEKMEAVIKEIKKMKAEKQNA